MNPSRNCNYCKNDFPLSKPQCSHCGQPSLFPNVDAAFMDQSFLQDRYDKAKEDAHSRKIIANVNDFEKNITASCAVINRGTSELLRLCQNDNEVSATYYKLSNSTKIQSGEIWDSRRQAADAIFFTGYHEEIHFACLSLNSTGLSNYGECSWVFRENMIAHRASLFEENTTLCYLSKSIKDADDIPKGFRAIWTDRAKLCVAKLASKIDITTKSAEYSNILLRQGATSAEDEFIEVHIFGSMTIRTIAEVTFNPVPDTISKKDRRLRLAQIGSIKEKLRKYGVKVNL